MIRFSHLADDEIRIVLHHLRLRDLLQLARCGSRTLRAADAPSAFRFAVMRRTSDDAAPPVDLVATRLLRHLRVAFFSHYSPQKLAASSFVSQLLAQLSSYPRVVSLDLLARSTIQPLAPAHWQSIVTHPSVQPCVREIKMHEITESVAKHTAGHCEIDTPTLRAIVSLPQLTALHIVPSFDSDAVSNEASGADWSLLSQASNLTSLTTEDDRRRRLPQSIMPFVSRCCSLTALEVAYPLLDEPQLLAFCRAMPQLQALLIHEYWAGGGAPHGWIAPSADTFAASFAALRSLRELSIAFLFDPDLLLAQLHHAPALCQLTLLPRAHGLAAAGSPAMLPSAPVLLSFLQRAPLRPTVRIQVFASMHVTHWNLESLRADAALAKNWETGLYREAPQLEEMRANKRLLIKLVSVS